MARKRSVTIDIVTDERDAVRGLQRLRGQAQVTEKGFLSFGRGVHAAVAGVATGAVVGFAAEMAKRGAQNEQILARFNTVFGNSADRVAAWARDNAEAFGESETGMKGLAAAAGDLLVPLGFTRTEVADLAPQVLEMANAFSVFTGGQVTAADAANKVQKAILGEREGLKELGIVVMEADVQARLAAKGQDELTGSAKDQAKALATLELIQERGADALSQYRAEGAGALEEQRALESQLAELADVMGELANSVLPPLIGGFANLTEGVVDFFTRSTPEHIETLTSRFKELGVEVDKAALAMSVGDEAATEALASLRDLGFSTADLTAAVLGGADGVEALRDRLIDANGDAGKFSATHEALAEVLRELEEEFVVAADAATEHAAAERTAGAAADAYQRDVVDLNAALQATTQTTEEAKAAAEALAAKYDAQRDAARRAWEAQRDLADAQRAAADPAFKLFDAFDSLIEAQETVNQLQADGKEGTVEYRDAVLEAAEKQGDFNAALEDFDQSAGATIGAFEALAREAGVSEDAIAQILDLLRGFADEANKIGGDIVAGIVGGVGNLGAELTNTMIRNVQTAMANTRDYIEALSPSRLFAREIGEPIGEGIAKGIEDSADAATDALRTTIDRIRDAGKAGVDAAFGPLREAFRLESAELAAERAADRLRAVREAFGEGEATQLELNEAVLRFKQAQAALLEQQIQQAGLPALVNQLNLPKGTREAILAAFEGGVGIGEGSRLPGLFTQAVAELLKAQLPSFAGPGVVPGRRNEPRLVVAHGGEPIGQQPRAAMWGPVNVYVTGSANMSPMEMERVVTRALRQVVNRNGTAGVG